MNLLEKLRSTIDRYQLLKRGDRVLVGVSGGPDSVALLYLLNSLREDYKLELYIAHLDHRLRRDSNKDLLFVKGLAKRLSLPITTKRIDVREKAIKGSIEEIARGLRYDFFFQAAKKFNAKKIALGHTQDDQAETVLMRIIRGTGLLGLSGILPTRKMNGFSIIRPLIEVERKEIEKFLKENNLRSRSDSSNIQLLYFRNRIRNRLMPYLKKYNPNIKKILANLAENSGLDYEYLHQQSERFLKSLNQKRKIKKVKNKPYVCLELERLMEAHPSLQRMVLRIAISRIKGNTRRLTYKHWRELQELIFHRPARSIVDLPGVCVQKQSSCLLVYPG